MISQFIRSILSPVVRIKKEEWPKTLLMFIYFFLTITSYYILKPVRDSIFIDKYGAENLPYFWLITIVVMSLIVSVYVKFVDYLQKNILLSSTVIFFISNLVCFWWLAHYDYQWVTGVFFVWVSIFSVMTVTQFWLYANDLFNPREAKRLFGFVGSGGILGGIVGGMITNQLAVSVGTRNLLLVAAFILLFCVILINIIWEMERSKGGAFVAEEGPASPAAVKETSKFIRYIWEKKYLLLLVGLVCVTKIVSTLVDYQFKNIVQDYVHGRDAKTAFFGNFYAWLNTVSFIVQFFLTSFILRRFGVGVALCLLPFGLAFGSVAILIQPALWSAVFTMIYDGSMNYSLNQSTKEVLYLPIFREIRYRVKPFIDMVGYRLAKAIGSILILFFTMYHRFTERSLSLISLLLIAVWFFMIKVMRKEYVNALRDFLKQDLPREQDKVVPLSETWLIYGLLMSGGKDIEKDLPLVVHLYHLACDPVFLNKLLEGEAPPYENMKARLHSLAEESRAENLYGEIQALLRTRSLEDSGKAIHFFLNYRKEGTEELNTGLASDDPAIQITSACLLILQGEEFPDSLIGQLVNLRESFPESNLAKIADAIEARHPEEPKPVIMQVLGWLSSDLALQGELAKEIQEAVKKDEKIFPAIALLIDEQHIPATYRRRLPLLLSICENQDAVYLLYRMLAEKDSLARDQAIHALVEIRAHSPERSFEELAIRREIQKEIDSNFLVQRLAELYRDWEPAKARDPKTKDSFLLAQENRFHEGVTRIFLLLSLLAEPQDIRTIYHSLNNPNQQIKANALELLENIIEQPHLKSAILRLVEADFAYQEKPGLGFSRMFRPVNGIESEKVLSMDEIFSKEDSWSFLSLSYIVLSRKMETFRPRLSLLSTSQNVFVREMATLVCQKFGKKA